MPLSERSTVDALRDQAFPMRLHAAHEVGEPRLTVARPHSLRYGACTWPHLPVEVVLVPGVLGPVVALTAEDVFAQLRRDAFARIERITLLKRDLAADVLERIVFKSLSVVEIAERAGRHHEVVSALHALKGREELVSGTAAASAPAHADRALRYVAE